VAHFFFSPFEVRAINYARTINSLIIRFCSLLFVSFEGREIEEQFWKIENSTRSIELFIERSMTTPSTSSLRATNVITPDVELPNSKKRNLARMSDQVLVSATLQKAILAKGRKALAIERNVTKNGLPSGWNDESLDAHILDKMYERLQGNREKEDDVERRIWR